MYRKITTISQTYQITDPESQLSREKKCVPHRRDASLYPLIVVGRLKERVKCQGPSLIQEGMS